MSRPKQIAAVALSVAGLASMAACGGNDGSSGLTSTSSTATSSSPSTTGSAGPTSSSTTDKTSTPTATGARASIPEAATKKTDSGAKAFVLFYHQQFNKAYMNGDPDAVKDLGTEDCNFCTQVIDDVTKYRQQGRRYDRPLITTKAIDAQPGKYKGEITVVTMTTAQRAVLRDEAGRAYETNDAAAAVKYFETVSWRADGWRLAEVAQS